MKVSLATQTICSSVADAIHYLTQLGLPQFHDSEATIEFITIFDKLFDIMNSRSSYGSGYKSSLSLRNKEYWLQAFKDSEKYIRELRLDDQPITNTKRKTFAFGFLINIHSFKGLANDLLTNISNPLKYFLTYKVSQDHIELYFSCIRSRGGWNNNPNIMQVLWSIRQLLYRNSVIPSINANCLSENYDPYSTRYPEYHPILILIILRSSVSA
jgi:hypothetical protein